MRERARDSKSEQNSDQQNWIIQCGEIYLKRKAICAIQFCPYIL